MRGAQHGEVDRHAEWEAAEEPAHELPDERAVLADAEQVPQDDPATSPPGAQED